MSREYRIYFGKKFSQQKDGYWANMMPIHAHRWVWINYYGSIPKGMDIHHKDGDKSNNEIDNLEMLSRSDHLKKHWADPKLREERRKFLDEIRPKVHEWLKSEQGREKQRIDAIKGWEKRKAKTFQCIQCGKDKITYQSKAQFCGNTCYMRHKRLLETSRVEAKCPICDKVYLKQKHTKQKFCSISCGAKNSARNRNNCIVS